MSDSLMAFIVPLFFILLAEMGDKTQLIALGLSTKYGARRVVTGIFIATIVLNAMAIAVGNVISRLGALQLFIEVAATLSFIAFGLWALKDSDTEHKQGCSTNRNIILTIACTFFIAELGDKTQLTTLAFATRFPNYPYMVFIGATIGMIIADSLGIILGSVMGKKLSERKIKLVSADVFILFGLFNTYQILIEKMKLGLPVTLAVISILFLAIVLLGTKILNKGYQV